MATNLTAKTLKARLLAEACEGYKIHALGDDVFCLIKDKGLWQVVYAERGSVQQVLFESTNETEACNFLYQKITGFRHDHVAGFFQSKAETEALSNQLSQLGIKNKVDSIHYRKDDWCYRVMVYGKDIFKVRRQYGQLPLERLPSLPERIHGAVKRLSEFVHEPDYKLNLPANEVEQQLWMALEHQCGHSLPEVYSRFVLEVGNGGRWGSVLKYLSVQEVFDANSEKLYKQSVPDFVQAAIRAGDLITVPSQGHDITAGFPGLLRISEFSYNGLACYLTSSNELVYIESVEDELSIQARKLTADQFFQQLLEDILVYGKLETYEHSLELMRFGLSLSELEQSLGMGAAGEWKHGIIAQILKTTPDNLGYKLTTWQEKYGTP